MTYDSELAHKVADRIMASATHTTLRTQFGVHQIGSLTQQPDGRGPITVILFEKPVSPIGMYDGDELRMWGVAIVDRHGMTPNYFKETGDATGESAVHRYLRVCVRTALAEGIDVA